ncbi:hypothetical protein JWH11_16470 [Xanthomonas melonis]|uniref:Uncharacterized protein n=1 Tax=Xanthomonas melonis TaxID=56456 RepID=A0ABS8NY43_9XANT|nr:hypothetical protein [Xanthomonas melonis]MCD0259495.1 hypothetical protein [Xanthomonas melonis]MCD0267990.1 hypothetical protein [Xanthomonas melonis]
MSPFGMGSPDGSAARTICQQYCSAMADAPADTIGRLGRAMPERMRGMANRHASPDPKLSCWLPGWPQVGWRR